MPRRSRLRAAVYRFGPGAQTCCAAAGHARRPSCALPEPRRARRAIARSFARGHAVRLRRAAARRTWRYREARGVARIAPIEPGSLDSDRVRRGSDAPFDVQWRRDEHELIAPVARAILRERSEHEELAERQAEQRQ